MFSKPRSESGATIPEVLVVGVLIGGLCAATLVYISVSKEAILSEYSEIFTTYKATLEEARNGGE